MSDLNLEYARAGAQFTLELLAKLKATSSKENIIISPFSIQTCMALVFAGAKGETANEIASTMKYVSNTTPEVAATFQHVLDKYQDSDLLKIANKVYLKDGLNIKSEYADIIKNQFHGAAESINFSENFQAAQTINTWVENKTAGKITNLIPAHVLGDDTRLVLLNALHFKGEWECPFEEDKTKEGDFWPSEEESVKVRYMYLNANMRYGYFHQYNCTALELPYKDSELSMFILLPEQRNGLQTLAEKLKDVNLLDFADKMSIEEVVVKFPKFKIDYSIEMKSVFQEMGIEKAFSESADFSEMLEPADAISISHIFHKTSIEINEEGAEAAAAISMSMMARCLLLPFEFVADHPFIYWIWDKKNILFAGVFVNAPKED